MKRSRYATDQKTYMDNIANGRAYGPGGNGPWPMRSVGSTIAWQTRRAKYGPTGLKKDARRWRKDIAEGKAVLPVRHVKAPDDMKTVGEHLFMPLFVLTFIVPVIPCGLLFLYFYFTR